MIGNPDAAALALSGHAPVLSYDGSTRYVYLIDGIVYKVENGYHYIGTNLSEYNNITNAETLPDGVYYPEVNLFDVDGVMVIAMEYIDGQAIAECFCTQDEECDDSCMTEEVWSKVNGVLGDTGGFNVIVNERGLFIIDAA